MKNRKRTLWVALTAILVLFAVAVVGCRDLGTRQQARANADLEPADVVTAFVGDLASETSASGQLLPKQKATLALGTSGSVVQVYVQVGDQVRAGDVLVQLDSDDLKRKVETAAQDLAIQEANLAELRKEPREKDVAAAQAAVANAQAQLDELLARPSAEELARAKAAVTSAEAALADLLAGPSAEELAQARANLESAQAAQRAAQARFEALDDQLAVAQNDIHSAQLGKDSARDQYNLLVWDDWKAGVSWGPYSPQGVAVKKAQVNYDVAVANYSLTELNINDSALRQAQLQVAQAQAALAALTDEKTAQIATAQAQVSRAEASLAALIEEKTVQTASTYAQLAQAKANLAKLLDGASQEQLISAEAQVEQARIALEEAQDNLAKATLVAPFDGMVTDVYVSIGEWASGPAVELVNTDSLHVVLDLDEIDIGRISIGQPALITLEPWPNQELNGEVVSIAPKAKNVGEIVTFEVHLRFDPGDLPVLTGMTANAELTTLERQNVLLIPNQAIVADRQADKYYVNRVEGESLTKVEVTLGLRDSNYTEITSGLEEGDRVSTGEIEEPGLDFRQGPPPEVHGFQR